MKKIIIKFSTVLLLCALLVMGASAITATYNNDTSPHGITLPASEGCGDNVVNLYVNESVTDYLAQHTSKYKWGTLLGSQDVLHACNAAKFEVSNRVIAETGIMPPPSSLKTDTFYGDDMTTSLYYNINNNFITTSNVILSTYCRYSTVVRNPYDQSIIKSDIHSHMM